MDPQPQEPTLDDSIKQVMQILPPPIRRYLSQGKYSLVAKNLMDRYGLHVDQGGILEREIMLLLMGIENQDEFAQALTEEANLDGKIVDDIMQDINTQIFVPLQEEMRKGAEIPGVVPEPPVPVPPPNNSETTGYFHLENKIPPPAVAPRPPSASPRIMDDATKLLADEKLLEDHEEPSIIINQIKKTVAPPANLPARMSLLLKLIFRRSFLRSHTPLIRIASRLTKNNVKNGDRG